MDLLWPVYRQHRLVQAWRLRPPLIREIFSTKEILENPGEDREIDMQLMRRKVKMEFLDDALVYDEKVASAGVFEKQRVRWLEAQLNHVESFF